VPTKRKPFLSSLKIGVVMRFLRLINFSPYLALNEWFVVDTSSKIRAVKLAKAQKGITLSKPPYGYIVDEKDKSVWHIDEEAAENVREIFKRVIAGDGPTAIAKDFNSCGIISLSACRVKCKGEDCSTIDTRWFPNSVNQILKSVSYTGVYISHRDTTVSYKNHKKITRPRRVGCNRRASSENYRQRAI